jgi:hypothetical protein
VQTFSSLPTISALTEGSIPFAGASGALSQDNANLFWDNTNNRLGVGTNSLADPLTVLGDVKIGNATTGTIKATTELVLRQDGDTYGPSILRMRNRNGENGAIFETTDGTITLVDFIFKTALNQRNIRYEARAGSAKTGAPSFHIGGSDPDNPNLSLGDNYAAFNEPLRIGNYTSPTAWLHLAAGTATASTAPLKFTSGTLLTTPEPGAIEFLTDNYYATITTGGARKTFAFLESPSFTGTVNINHNSTTNVTNIGTGTTTGTVTIGGDAAQQIDIGAGTGVQTLNLGTGATGAKTVNIGTGAVSNSISIGTVTGTSSLTLRAGSGNVVIPDGVMLDLSQVNTSATTEGLKLPQSSNTSAATAEGQIAWNSTQDVLTVGTGTVARNIGVPNGMIGITASTTFVHPVGVQYVWVKVWGGGGGGGNGTAAPRGAGAGGGGAYSEGLVDVSDAASHAVVVGTGGAANGGNGTASSFTATAMTVSANGGTGVGASSTGGAGGTTSGNGTIRIAGGKGGDASASSGAGGGTGGGSPFGGAGGGGGVGGNLLSPNSAGTTGTFPGGGGGGGSATGGAGAAGAAGYVLIYW